MRGLELGVFVLLFFFFLGGSQVEEAQKFLDVTLPCT